MSGAVTRVILVVVIGSESSSWEPGGISYRPGKRPLPQPSSPTNLRSSIEPFGLTERKSRFLVTVMLHGGVFVGRQYAAFAGITHGQKVHVFIEKLLARRFVTAIRLGPNGRTRLFHVHH